ncbi:MAG: hypothetical protein C9356_11155 [Oleiphilus sp.]|nr:MAG: hypothetical protein C9356_11155 [Oleiphilus sp.]
MYIKSILVIAISTFFLAQISLAEGLAERQSEVWSTPSGIDHVHSNQRALSGAMGGTEGLADRRAHRQDTAIVIDHIHKMHGDTAAGSKGDYESHGHNVHKHTVRSAWSDMPRDLTAHQKKRLMFD